MDELNKKVILRADLIFLVYFLASRQVKYKPRGLSDVCKSNISNNNIAKEQNNNRIP